MAGKPQTKKTARVRSFGVGKGTSPMRHEEVLESVDAQFLAGWQKAKSAHLALNINPLNGLENVIEKMFEEMGWEQIDHDVLRAYVPNGAKYADLEARRATGEPLEAAENLQFNQMQNRALGEYGKVVFDQIKQRHGL